MITNDVEHRFMCLLSIHMFYFMKNLINLLIFVYVKVCVHIKTCTKFSIEVLTTIAWKKKKKWNWSVSVMSNSATPWTVAWQAPPSMGFSRQEYRSGLPFPSAGDLPDPGIEPRSSAFQADSLPPEAPGNPYSCIQ